MVVLIACVTLLMLVVAAFTILTQPKEATALDLLTEDDLRNVYVMLHDFKNYLGPEAMKAWELDAIEAYTTFYRAVTLGS